MYKLVVRNCEVFVLPTVVNKLLIKMSNPSVDESGGFLQRPSQMESVRGTPVSRLSGPNSAMELIMERLDTLFWAAPGNCIGTTRG